jgi:hypothetical protein
MAFKTHAPDSFYLISHCLFNSINLVNNHLFCFTILMNTSFSAPGKNEGGNRACPPMQPPRLTRMTQYLFGSYRIWGAKAAG